MECCKIFCSFLALQGVEHSPVMVNVLQMSLYLKNCLGFITGLRFATMYAKIHCTYLDLYFFYHLKKKKADIQKGSEERIVYWGLQILEIFKSWYHIF